LERLRSRIWRYDRETHVTTLVSRRTGAAGGTAGGYASEPSISADGTRVRLLDRRQPLRAQAHGLTGVFVRDLAANTTTLLSAHAARRARRGPQASWTATTSSSARWRRRDFTTSVAKSG